MGIDENQSTHSLTALLALYDSSMDPRTMNNALLKSGILVQVHYNSTTTGKPKTYNTFTDSGRYYGNDMPTAHEFRTEPRYYRETFPELLVLISEHLLEESQNIVDNKAEV